MIRKATPQDLAALMDFLRPRAATSLFLSGHLLDHGLNATGHPRATTVWIATGNGEIQAAFGCSEQGFLNCEAPDFDPEWSADLRREMAGRHVIGMSGEVGQIVAFRRALGLTDRAVSFEDVEPHFVLDLNDLVVPDGTTTLHHVTEADQSQVLDWRIIYDREVYGDADTPEMRCKSEEQATEVVQSGHMRLLQQHRMPVAMTAFNAATPDTVQIGSVYTPPALRGQGHARRAVALHLAEARAEGVKSAVLFASGPAAVRAYQSIGFTRIGDYTQVLFADPFNLGDPA